MIELLLLVLFFIGASLVAGVLTSFTASWVGLFLIGSDAAKNHILNRAYYPHFEGIYPYPRLEYYLNFVFSFMVLNMKILLPLFVIYGILIPIHMEFELSTFFLPVLFTALPIIYFFFLWGIYCTDAGMKLRPSIFDGMNNQVHPLKDKATLLVLIIPYTFVVLLSTIIGYVFVFTLLSVAI